MPLNRHHLSNEYSLADPELYKVADKDDPEALLEAVAMAGLVGVLRQLGDLAQFAAEIFHDLHEEVMATSARGHGLIVRVQQLEAEFPSIERALLSQTSHTSFLYNTGVDWHPNLRMDQGVVNQGDLPRFVMDSYEECRGPPRLFLLDKFDVAGAGACLKRFTDPSFFKTESISTGRNLEGQREKKMRRVKKRGPRWRNGDTPESFPSSHAKLHQLFLEERIESGINNPARRVKLKKRQFTGSLFEQDNVKSYMEKFLDTSPLEQKILHEICVDPLALTWISDNGCEAGSEILEIGTVSPAKVSIQTDRSLCSSPDARETLVKPSLGEDFNHDKLNFTSDINLKVVGGEEIAAKESMSEVSVDDASDCDDVASEIDNYVDALANIESEVETDSDSKKNPHYLNMKPIVTDSDGSERQQEFTRLSLDSQYLGNSIISEDGDHCSIKRKHSSYSNSVNALMVTTPDRYTAVVAVTTSQACISDSGNLFFDHHSTSEEILRKEREKHAATGVVNPEVHDVLKSEQEFVKALNTSSLAVNMEIPQKENSLLDPELEYSTRLDVAEGDMDQGLTDQTVNFPSYRTFSVTSEDSGQFFSLEPSVLDKEGHNSENLHGTSIISNGLVNLLETDSHDSACSSVARHGKDLGMADIDTFSDSGLCSEYLPSFDPAYSEKVNFINVACEEDDCILSNNTNSKDLYPDSDSKSSVSFVAEISDAFSRDDNNEISGSVDNIVKNSLMLGKPSPMLDPLEVPHECLKLPSDVTDSTLLELGKDEAHKQYSDNEICTGCSVSVDGNEGNASPLVDLSDREPVYQKFSSVNPDQTQAFESDNLVDDPESQVETVYGEASTDCASNDRLGKEDSIISHDASLLHITCKYANTSDHVVAAANDSNVDNDVEKVDHIETIADGPKLVDVLDNYHQNGTTEQLCQNDEELAKGHRRALTDRRQTNPAQDASVTSSGIMCNMPSDDSSSLKVLDFLQPADVKISEKLSGEAEDLNPPSHDLLKSQFCEREEGAGVAILHDDDLPSLSKYSPLSAENIQETNVAIHGNGLLNGGNEASLLENSDQPLRQQVFLDLGMLPAEPQISLEPPSLPPLPPMQWRLGRFQNSAVLAAGRQTMQHPRVPFQVQPMSLPTMHHTLAPVQSTTLPSVHHSIASFQPLALAAGNSTLAQISPSILPTALPAVNYTFAPLHPGALPTTAYGSENIARIHPSEGQLGYPDAYVTQQGVFTIPLPVGVSEGFLQSNTSAVGRQDYLASTIPLTSANLDAAQQGIFTPSMPARISEGSSESNTSEAGRQDNIPFVISSSSTMLPDGTQISTKSHELNPDLSESRSVVEVHCSEYTSTKESQMNTETAIQNELFEHGLQVSQEEIVDSNMQPLLTSVVEQATPGLVAPEAGITWLSAYDGISTNEDGNINGTLQKKPPRLRNPLIDEVVAIDKSKLRKVDRTRPPTESKLEEGESLWEQMQLRKVERVKPPVDSKGEGGEYLLEQLQLRKVGERVKPPVEQKSEEFLLEQLQLRKVERDKLPMEPKSEERESLLEQLQLRKVGEKTRREIEPKVDETESPRIQLRKVGERVREEVELKAEETESPRLQLRKVGERAQPPNGQKVEERDSLFEQIRNKSFNLKPAVAARPNIQGPRTNLKVAAILEKASTIRQAMVGSDEDDDADSWSE